MKDALGAVQSVVVFGGTSELRVRCSERANLRGAVRFPPRVRRVRQLGGLAMPAQAFNFQLLAPERTRVRQVRHVAGFEGCGGVLRSPSC